MEPRKIKILVIDDNQDNITSVKAQLKEIFPGAGIYTALTGEKGLELAITEDPDVILLDIIMPVMDGFEVCKRLKADQRLCEIPVIFLTAIKGDKESRINALKAGAESFLSKPIDETELTAQIQAMVKIKNAAIQKRDENERLTLLVNEQMSELKETHKATLNLLEDLAKENEARKKSEKALTESQQITEGIINTIPVRVFWKDKNLVYLGCNRIFANDAGFADSKNIIGKDDYQMVWHDQAEMYRTDDLQVIRTGCARLNIEEIQTTPQGNTIALLTNKIPLLNSEGEITGILGTYIDITERKQTEDALRESEEKFSVAFKTSPYAITITQPDDGLFVEVNDTFYTMTGFTREETFKNASIGMGLWVDEDNRNSVVRDLLHGDKVVGREFDFKKKNGEIITGLFSAHLIHIKNKTYILSSINDITERKHSEEKLRASEEKFRNLYENAPLPYQSVDENAVIMDVNPAWLKTLEYEKEEVIGKYFTDFLMEGQNEKYNAIFSTMKTVGFSHNIELDMICKSGKIINALFDGIANYAPDGKFICTYTTFKDITREKQFDKLITNAIVDSEEKQRVIFAQELHDGLGPMLSSIKLFLKSMVNKKRDENIEPLITRVNDIIDGSITILKELSLNMSPHVLTNHGLNSALTEFFGKIKRDNMKLTYKTGLKCRLSNSIEIGLYRVITEMVNNSLKYADAGQIKIILSKNDDKLTLNYSDDGCGFDVDSMLLANKGNGLFNIINRMKSMEAEYRFTSSKGSGFSFYACINL